MVAVSYSPSSGRDVNGMRGICFLKRPVILPCRARTCCIRNGIRKRFRAANNLAPNWCNLNAQWDTSQISKYFYYMHASQRAGAMTTVVLRRRRWRNTLCLRSDIRECPCARSPFEFGSNGLFEESMWRLHIQCVRVCGNTPHVEHTLVLVAACNFYLFLSSQRTSCARRTSKSRAVMVASSVINWP